MVEQSDSWVRRALAWAAIVAGGVLVGLLLAFSVLWWQSSTAVRRWIADPARTAPGVIWSAPIEVRVGQSATVSELAGDLLAAGYSKVDALPDEPAGTSPVGVFAIDGDTLSVWTEPMTGPDFGVPASEAEIVVRDGRVRELVGGDPVVLRPTVLATIGDPQERRSPVDLDEVSPWVEPAVLAIEDERFRKHVGVDLRGVVRAARENLAEGETVEGGSTITQQLAKNLFLTPERTLRRKLREAVLAVSLEIYLTKDEILELYLGEVYYGQMGGLPLYGIQDAARAWFGKQPKLLELHEAALVAGVIAAPNRYSPVRHPWAARQRRDLVLDRMAELGLVDRTAAAEAKERPLDLEGLEPSLVRRAPYAVDYAVDVAERELGDGALATNGYQVWTWIQPQVQRTAEQAIRDGLDELGRDGAQSALVAVRNSDGGIVAMVGGRSYVDSPYNRAVDARRQAGSTVKPLTLLAALDARLVRLSDLLVDAPITRDHGGRTWTPRNYDGGFVGPVTVRTAIEHSRNVPAVLLAERVGMGRLQDVWHDLGLSGATAWPSAALGAFEVSPIELAGAYTVFPNGGVRREPQIVRAITTADGREVRRFGSDALRVADPQSTALAVSVLEGVMRRGTGARGWQYGIQPPIAGKSGTTDRFRDAWFVGFTPELSVAVWVGRDRDEIGLSGSRAALPTWARFMARAGVSGGEFPAPDGLVAATICADTGQAAAPGCPHTYTEEFVRGTQPATVCELHRPRLRFDLWDRIWGPGDDTGGYWLDEPGAPDDHEPLYPLPDDLPEERDHVDMGDIPPAPRPADEGPPVEDRAPREEAPEDEPDVERSDERPEPGRAVRPRRVREGAEPAPEPAEPPEPAAPEGPESPSEEELREQMREEIREEIRRERERRSAPDMRPE